MTAPRPAGERICDEPLCTVTLPHHTHVDVADRAWCCGPYPYTARPASPPAGAEADEELREALAQALHQARCGPKCPVRPSDQNARDADALLSGPLAALVRERDEAKADRDRLVRVLQLVAEWVGRLEGLAASGRDALSAEVRHQASLMREALDGDR